MINDPLCIWTSSTVVMCYGSLPAGKLENQQWDHGGQSAAGNRLSLAELHQHNIWQCSVQSMEWRFYTDAVSRRPVVFPTPSSSNISPSLKVMWSTFELKNVLSSMKLLMRLSALQWCAWWVTALCRQCRLTDGWFWNEQSALWWSCCEAQASITVMQPVRTCKKTNTF